MCAIKNYLRKFVIFFTALQLLNVSVGTYPVFGDDLNSFEQKITGKDPTETFIEFIVEAEYGQKDIFTCTENHNHDGGKNIVKTCQLEFTINSKYAGYSTPFYLSAKKTKIIYNSNIISHSLQTASPPPEHSI